MDKLMLDGNAVAGLLQEVFAVEMTTAVGTCEGCGAAGPVGAVHVYRGAGIVLRPAAPLRPLDYGAPRRAAAPARGRGARPSSADRSRRRAGARSARAA